MTGRLRDDDGDADNDGLLDSKQDLNNDGIVDAPYTAENSGLNRVLGGERNDTLFGGTSLDFLYGNGGTDTLVRANGTTFQSLDDGVAGDDWKKYARESDQVWYVGGTNAADEIRVDFVTEPGVLADHHLVTRLTNNNGQFSFAAQVRLDFGATDDSGNLIWNPQDLKLDIDNLLAAQAAGDTTKVDGMLSKVGIAQTNLISSLLPGEGDFQVILVDALDGNDLVTVGPTVQKSVWVDGGAGDDKIEIRSGNAILTDKAENSTPVSGLRGRNDIPTQAFALVKSEGGLAKTFDGKTITSGATFTGLTLDSAQDVDWYSFTLPTNTPSTAKLQLSSGSPIDSLQLDLFLPDPGDFSATQFADNSRIRTSTFTTSGNASSINFNNLPAGFTIFLKVTSPNVVPTIYDLRLNLTGTSDAAQLAAFQVSDLATRPDAERRDVILGGTGDDILRGGAGEDWIFGQAGNDVLTGGQDRNASDLIFGGSGDDTFQLIPDALPLLGNQVDTKFNPATQTYVPTSSDLFAGGDGKDRVLFLGGDKDRRGFDVPDYAMLGYDSALHRYEFSALRWDIGNQEFQTETDAEGRLQYSRDVAYYHTRDIETTEVDTRAGSDVFHADESFKFGPISSPLLHRYSFSGTGQDGAAITNSFGTSNGVLRGDTGGTVSTALTGSGGVSLRGGASSNTGYVDLPNGLISGLTEATFETWVTLDTRTAGSKLFDFNGGTEITAVGGTFTPTSEFALMPEAAFVDSGSRGNASISPVGTTASIEAGKTVANAVVRNAADDVILIYDGTHATNTSQTPLNGLLIEQKQGNGSYTSYALLDIGAAGQVVQSGAIGLNAPNGNSSFPGLTSSAATASDTFSVALSTLDQFNQVVGALEARDRGNSAVAPLQQIGEDMVKTNSGIIRVTLGSLPVGEYRITGYHADLLVPGASANSIATFINAATAPTAVMQLVHRGNGGNYFYQGSQALPVDGLQHHVAVTFVSDPTPNEGGEGRARIYLDGVQIADVPANQALAGIEDVNAWLGRSGFSADANLDGTIDEFRIHQRALTADQIQRSFQLGASSNFGLVTESLQEQVGLQRGNFEQHAVEAALKIDGGDGNDFLYGGPLADTIIGGEGVDYIVGGLGADSITGDGGADKLFGHTPDLANQNAQFPHNPAKPSIFLTQDFASELYTYDLAAPFLNLDLDTRPGVRLDSLTTAPTDPLVYYSFNNSSDLGHDDSGNGRNSSGLTSITASAAGVSGATGGAAQFTNTTSKIRIGNSVNAGANWTAAVWFKDVVNTSADNRLFQSGSSDNTQLYIVGGTNNVGGYLRYSGQFRDSGYDLDPVATAGQWHHLTAVGTNGVTRVYVDGLNVGTMDRQAGNVFDWLGNSDAGGAQFASALDEFYLYDRALSTTEVAQLYDAGLGVIGSVDSTSFGVEGSHVGERLKDAVPVGDFNGDGKNDFLFTSTDYSYLVYGPVALTDMESVEDRADIVIDHTAIGLPGDRFGDVNGDGFADLAFVRKSGTDQLVTIVLGGQTGGIQAGQAIAWPRFWDAQFVSQFLVTAGSGNNARTIRLPAGAVSTANGVSVQIFETTGDTFDDVLITGRSTLNAPNTVSGQLNVGHVFSGSDVTSFVATSTAPDLVLANRLASIRTGTGFDDLTARVVGDVNGDGRDDVLFSNPAIDVAVHEVTPAIVTASLTQNFTQGITAVMTVTVNGVSAVLLVPTDRNDTAANVVNKVNTAIQSSLVANKVRAELNASVIRFVTEEAGSDVSLSVYESTATQLGFAAPPSVSTQTATDVPKTFGSSPVTVNSTKSVSSLTGTIVDLNVTLSITHAWNDDVLATLIGPDGTRVTLIQNVGSSSDNFTTTKFDDSAATPIASGTAPFTGTFRPTGSLSAFNGKSPNGTWTLELTDIFPSADNGTLTAWSMEISTVASPNVGTETLLPALSLNDPLVTGLTDNNKLLRVTLSTGNVQHFDPLSLGDLNRDGYDDVGFAGPNGVQVFYGAADAATVMTAADVSISGNDLKALGGDFNGDGKGDLAITGRPLTSIPLGNLFDDANTASLGAALLTDTFKATAAASDLGVDRVVQGGNATVSLNGSVNFNFTNLGWTTGTTGSATNDAFIEDGGSAGLRTVGSRLTAADLEFEEGVGLHANQFVTFDLNEIRAAGGLASTAALRFLADRAGLNDTAQQDGIPDAHLVVLVSDASGVIAGYVNGQPVAVTNSSGTWSFSGSLPTSLLGNSRFAPFDVALASSARYLTLAATQGNNGNNFGDHAVFSGARLEVSAANPRETMPQTVVFNSITDQAAGTVLAFSQANVFLQPNGVDQTFNGLRFDGGDVAFLPHTLYDGQRDVTTTFSVRTTSVHSQSLINGARSSDGTFTDNEYTIGVEAGNRMYVIVKGNYVNVTTPEYADGNFHHFAVVTREASDRLEVYMDGHLVADVAMTVGIPQISEGGLTVGQDQDALGTNFSSFYATQADIDELTIWSRALTSDEVRSVRDGQFLPNATGLKAWYRFNETSGTTLVDATGRNANATLGVTGQPTTIPTRFTLFSPDNALPYQPLDLNADGLSDLVINTAYSTVTDLGNAGRIDVIYGHRARMTLPVEFDVLENISVSGSGSYVVNRGTGQPELFDVGGDSFTFATGTTERWFRFSTLGDGSANNVIRFNGNVRADLLDSDGGVLKTGLAAVSLRDIEAGTYFLRVHVTSIPLGNLLDDSASATVSTAINTDTFRATAEITDLGVDKVIQAGTTTQTLNAAGTISFNLTNLGWENASYSLPTNDAGTPNGGEFVISTRQSSTFISGTKVEDGIGMHANGVLTFDLNELRAAGELPADTLYQFLVDRAGVTDGYGGSIRTAVIVSSETGVLSGYVRGQQVAVTNTVGTWAFSGTIPGTETNAGGFASYNISIPSNARYLSLIVTGAGNGIGTDVGVFSGVRLVPAPTFTISADAPIRGQTHESATLPDRDIVRGGDGDDLIQGNNDLDRLFGESGADTFFGEPTEIHDRDIADQQDGVVPSSETSFGNAAPVLDPVIGNFRSTVFSENFDTGTFTGNTNFPSVTNATVDGVGLNEPSGAFSARLNGPNSDPMVPDAITSKQVDLFGLTKAELTYSYQQRGGGESPDTDDNLIVKYSVDGTNFVELDKQLGSGPDQKVFTKRTLALPPEALRSKFQLRFETTGSLGAFDDWFVDDVSITTIGDGSPEFRAAVATAIGSPVTTRGGDGTSFSLDFDGVDDKVEVPFDANLNGADFSVEMWVRVEGGSGTYRSAITSRDDVSGDLRGYIIYATPNNTWEFWTGSGAARWDVLGGGSVTPNQWTHLAITFDASGAAAGDGSYTGTKKFFINGDLVASTSSQRYEPNTARNLRIGAGATEVGGAPYAFNGKIDEVRVWNSALADDTIESQYRSVITTTPTGLIGNWHLDNGSGTSATDSAGTANTGTLSGGPVWSSTTFNQRPFVRDTLTASELASIKSFNASNGGLSDLTGAEFLTNVTNLNLAGNNLDNADLANLAPRRLLTGPQAGELVGLPRLSSLDLSDNAGITNISSLTSFPNLTSLNLAKTGIDPIGATTLSTLQTLNSLKTVNMSTKFLTANQNLVQSEGQTVQIPVSLNALNLDGVDDRVDIGIAQSLGSLTNNLTVAGWIKPDVVTGTRRIFGSKTTAGWSFGLGGTDLLFTTHFVQDYGSPAANLQAGVWTHVAATMSSSNTVEFFVNGVSIGSVAGSAPASPTTAGYNIGALLGAGFADTNQFFDGALSDIGVWNRVLTPAELANVMRGQTKSLLANTVGFWPLNEGSGTNVRDISNSGIQGTLINGPAWSVDTSLPWSVTGPSTASGTSGKVIFNTADEGLHIVTVRGEQFPVWVRNVVPTLTATPNLGLANSGTGVNEGQTLQLGTPRINGLNELWFDGSFGDTNIDSIDPITNSSSLLASTPNSRSMLNTSLSFTGAQMDARSGGVIGVDGIGAVWVGKVVVGATGSGAPLTAGAVTFGTASDDGSVFFVDVNQNDRFEAGELIVNNKGSHGVINAVGTTPLAAGTYNIAIGFYEGGSSEFMEARYAQGTVALGSYGTMTIVNPAAATQNGLWLPLTDARVELPVGIANNSKFTSADIPKTFGASPVTTTSAITVSGQQGVVSDVNLTLSINHTYDEDVQAVLIAPDGTRLTLLSGIGSAGDNFTSTTLDDSAGTLISAASAPFTGTFRPVNALAVLNGKSPNGTWTLELTDTFPGADNGTLTAWSLDLSTFLEVDKLITTEAALGDAQGLQQTVTITGPDGTVTDLTSRARQFANSSLTLPTTVLDGATSLTTTFWLKTAQTGSQTVLSALNDSQSATEFEIRLDDAVTVSVVDRNQRTFSFRAPASVPNLADNTYHHFALVRDAEAGTLSLLIDGVAAPAGFSDSFDQSVIDPSLWATPRPVTTVLGSAYLSDRGYLNTVQSFDPSQGQVRITGDAYLLSATDLFQVLTRSDGIPKTDFFFETNSGVEVNLNAATDTLSIIERTNGMENVKASVTFAADFGSSFTFDFTDDGTTVTATFRNTFTGATATVTTTSALTSTKNLVTIHNREGAQTSVLNNVTVTQVGATVPTLELAPLSIDDAGVILGKQQFVVGSPALMAGPLVGTLDDFTIWNRALTAAEIAQIRAGQVDATSSSLQVWLPFNEVSGSAAQDRSSNGLGGAVNTATYAATVLGQTPIAYYPLNDSTGTQATDASGNSFTGTYVGPVTRNQPAASSALGTSPRFVNSTPATSVLLPSLGAPSQATIEAWVNPSSFAGFDSLYMTETGGSGNLHIQFVDGLRVTQFEASDLDFGTAANFPLNQWTHVVITLNADADTITVYANGVSLGTQSAAMSAINLGVARIGAWFDGSSVVRKFDGRIDDVAIYHSALTADQVRQHYAAAFSGPTADVPAATVSKLTVPDNGVYTLHITTSDGDGGTDTAERTFTVNNVAPVISGLNASSATGAIGTPLTFNAKNASDAGSADTLTYLWEVTNNNGQSIAASDLIDFTFTPQFAGTYVVKLTVTDDDGASTQFTQTYNVNPVAVISGTPAANVQLGSLVTLDALSSSALAAQGALIGTGMNVVREYLWSVLPTTALLTGTTGSTVNIIPLTAGAQTVTLTITDVFTTDGVGGSTRLSHTVNVPFTAIAVAAPTITPSTAAPLEGDVITLTPGNLPALPNVANSIAVSRAYLWHVTASNGQTITDGTGETFTFTPRDEGTYTTQLTVTDTFGASTVTRTQSLVSNVANAAPSLMVELFPVLVPGQPTLISALVIEPSTVDTVNFSINWGDGVTDTGSVTLGATPLGQEGIFNGTHTFATQGNKTVIVTVTDNDGGSTVQNLIILDQTLPTADILDVTPDPRKINAGTVTVDFSEAVTGVDVTDFVLTRNGTQVDISGVTFTAVSTTRYTLNLSGVTTTDGTYELSLRADGSGISDAANNAPPVDVIDSWVMDTVAPTATLTDFDATVLDHGVGVASIVFSEPVTGFDLADLSLTRNGSGVSLTGLVLEQVSATEYSIDLTSVAGTGGSYVLTLTGTSITDAATNAQANVTSSFSLEQVAPTGSLTLDLASPHNGTFGVATLIFSENVSGVNLADLSLTRDGSPVSLTGLTLTEETPAIYTIDLSTVTALAGNYVLTVTASGSGIRDAVQNALTTNVVAGFVVDLTAPTINIVDVTPDPRTTGIGVVRFTASEAVTGLDIADLVLTRDGVQLDLTGAVLNQVDATNYEIDLTQLTSSSAAFDDGAGGTITVTQGIEGVYDLSIATAAAGISDLAGNAFTSTTTESFQIDLTGPNGAFSGTPAAATNQAVGLVTVSFNEAVQGVGISDFALTRNGTPVSISGVPFSTVDSKNYTLNLSSVTTVAGNYELRLIAATTGTPNVTDLLNHGLNGDAFALFTIDKSVPTAAISDVQPSPRNSLVDSVVISFSEPVTGFGIEDLSLTLGGTPVDISLQTLTAISDTSYSLDLAALTGLSGSYVLTLTASGSGILDLSGNAIAANATETWTTDLSAPIATFAGVTPNPRSTAAGAVTVSFDDAVTGVDLSDFTLTRDGDAIDLTGLTVTTISAQSYSINLSSVTSTAGTYLLVLRGSDSGINNLAGLTMAADGMTTFVVDTTAPVATITTIDAANPTIFPTQFTVDFTESVSGVDLSDFTLTRNGSPAALTGASVTTVSATQYVLNLGTSTTLDGTYELTLNRTGSAILDGAGNLVGSSVTGSRLKDTATPAATFSPVTPDPRTTPAGIITVSFSEPAINVDITDFVLTRDGQFVTIYTAEFTEIDLQHVTIDLTEFTDVDGVYVLTVAADSDISDLSNNAVTGVAEQWTKDTAAPIADITDITPDPRTLNAGTVTVQFNEPVTGLDLSDFTLTRDGTPVALTGVTFTAVTPTTYTLNLSAVTTAFGQYSLTLNQAGSSVQDLTANPLAEDAEDSWTIVPEMLEVQSGGPYFVQPGTALEVESTVIGSMNTFQFAWDLNLDGVTDFVSNTATASIPWLTVANSGLGAGVHQIAVSLKIGGGVVATDFTDLFVGDTYQLDMSTLGSNLRLSRTNTEFEVRDTSNTLLSHAFANGISQINVTGTTASDTLTLDFTTSGLIPLGGIHFDADTQTAGVGDSLRLMNGTVGSVTHHFTSATDGNITVDGFTVTYTGLEPLVDSLTSTTRIFDFGDLGDIVELADDTTVGDGQLLLSSTTSRPTLNFKAPTGSLFINTNGGDDTITLNAIDSLFTAAGNLNGGSGNDRLIASGDRDFTLLSGKFSADVDYQLASIESAQLTGGAGNNNLNAGGFLGSVTLTGGAGDDSLQAGFGADLVIGGDGNDFLLGGMGNDTLQGQAGTDIILGAGGNDLIDGGTEDDHIQGQGGNDTITGGLGNEFIDGGTGTDLIIESGDSNVVITDTSLTGIGTDKLAGVEAVSVTGGAAANLLDAGAFSGQVTLIGLGGNDTLVAAAGVDSLDGGSGTDLLRAAGDRNFTLTNTQLGGPTIDIIAGFESAELTGGNGANTLDASAFTGTVKLTGGSGNDTLIGGTLNDTLVGEAGNDVLTGGTGADSFIGGTGNDAIKEVFDFDLTLTNTSLLVSKAGSTSTTDVLAELEFADLTGGTSKNKIDLSGFAASLGTTITGGGGNDTIFGSPAADVIFTGSLADSINGNAGGDTIFAGSGNDTISGGDGNDNLSGQNGDDSLLGDAGNDVLTGGAGIDTMLGGIGNDFLSGQTEAGLLFGGDGNDTLQGATANDTLQGDAGDDRLFGLQGNDVISGGDGADSLLGGSGNDSMDGAAGADTLQGDVGNDTLEGGADFDRINEVLDTNITITATNLNSGLGVDLYSGIDRIQLNGGAGNNLFDARLATVPLLLAGDAGNDTLLGGSKGDGILGGEGDDVLSGGPGGDIIDGGNGNDFWFESADTNFTVNGVTVSSAVTGTETGTSVERIALIGGIGANKLDASLATVPVVLLGGRGNDTLLGGSGADTLSGGNRNDATVVGGDGTDTLDGGPGSDVLENDPADTLVPGSGDTTIADVFTLLPSWIDAL